MSNQFLGEYRSRKLHKAAANICSYRENISEEILPTQLTDLMVAVMAAAKAEVMAAPTRTKSGGALSGQAPSFAGHGEWPLLSREVLQ